MLYVEIETNTDLSTENKTQNMRYKDKFNNLYLLNMFKNSTLFEKNFLLAKTAPKFRRKATQTKT